MRAQTIRELRPDDDPIALARTLQLVALMNRYSGNYAAAMPPLDRALATRDRLSPDHPETALARHLQGEIRWLTGDIRVPSDRGQRPWLWGNGPSVRSTR